MMKFRLGINYWPASKAMYWWRHFDASEVQRDFERIHSAGMESVRIFLLWEDFQPAPRRISEAALQHLVETADAATRNSLSLIVTLFVGHMSGVNWIPAWALSSNKLAGRFRTVSDGRVVEAQPRNWYSDTEILQAQILLAREVAGALRAHPALEAYDLGNESSNCVRPVTREAAMAWLARISEAIRAVDSHGLITIGLHAEDLEEDRCLGPAEAAGVCDFLSMHGYPIYLRWAESAEDERVLPFLGLLTRWLGGRDVLFEEFGIPAVRDVPPHERVPVFGEEQAARYTRRGLEMLHRFGFRGALLWCFADYAESLWKAPPLDQAVHERHFGLWRSDHSPKAALAEVQRFAGSERLPLSEEYDWVDLPADEYYRDPSAHLRRLYQNFCNSCAKEGVQCLP